MRRWCNNCSRTQTLIIIVKCHQIASFCFVIHVRTYTHTRIHIREHVRHDNGEQLVMGMENTKQILWLQDVKKEMEIGKGCYCFKYIYNISFYARTYTLTDRQRHIIMNVTFRFLIKSFSFIYGNCWINRFFCVFPSFFEMKQTFESFFETKTQN